MQNKNNLDIECLFFLILLFALALFHNEILILIDPAYENLLIRNLCP